MTMMVCNSANSCKKTQCSHKKPHDENVGCNHECDVPCGLKGSVCVSVVYHAEDIGKNQQPTNPVSINTESLTEERGKNYGHPRDHFACTRGMYFVWETRRNQVVAKSGLGEHEEAMRHAAYMICDKLARMANNPMHKDNLDDIAGYARTAKMVLGLED